MVGSPLPQYALAACRYDVSAIRQIFRNGLAGFTIGWRISE